ncbi:MAG: hypothetical protein WDW36_001994 [Sanguina aurantia]
MNRAPALAFVRRAVQIDRRAVQGFGQVAASKPSAFATIVVLARCAAGVAWPGPHARARIAVARSTASATPASAPSRAPHRGATATIAQRHFAGFRGVGRAESLGARCAMRTRAHLLTVAMCARRRILPVRFAGRRRSLRHADRRSRAARQAAAAPRAAPARRRATCRAHGIQRHRGVSRCSFDARDRALRRAAIHRPRWITMRLASRASSAADAIRWARARQRSSPVPCVRLSSERGLAVRFPMVDATEDVGAQRLRRNRYRVMREAAGAAPRRRAPAASARGTRFARRVALASFAHRRAQCKLLHRAAIARARAALRVLFGFSVGRWAAARVSAPARAHRRPGGAQCRARLRACARAVLPACTSMTRAAISVAAAPRVARARMAAIAHRARSASIARHGHAAHRAAAVALISASIGSLDRRRAAGRVARSARAGRWPRSRTVAPFADPASRAKGAPRRVAQVTRTDGARKWRQGRSRCASAQRRDRASSFRAAGSAPAINRDHPARAARKWRASARASIARALGESRFFPRAASRAAVVHLASRRLLKTDIAERALVAVEIGRAPHRSHRTRATGHSRVGICSDAGGAMDRHRAVRAGASMRAAALIGSRLALALRELDRALRATCASSRARSRAARARAPRASRARACAHARRIDPLGQLLVFLILATVPHARRAGPDGIGLFSVAALALITLLVNEPRRHEPLIDLRFFRSAPFSSATIIAVCNFAGFGGFLFLNTLYLQEARGFFMPRRPLGMFNAPTPGSSLTWMIELLRDRYDDLGLDDWRIDARLVAARDGYTTHGSCADDDARGDDLAADAVVDGLGRWRVAGIAFVFLWFFGGAMVIAHSRGAATEMRIGTCAHAARALGERARERRFAHAAGRASRAALQARLLDAPLTLTQLAEATGSDAPATTVAVNDLESRGLVERYPHPDNRRAKLVSLTPAGRRMVEVTRQNRHMVLPDRDSSGRCVCHQTLLTS